MLGSCCNLPYAHGWNIFYGFDKGCTNGESRRQGAKQGKRVHQKVNGRECALLVTEVDTAAEVFTINRTWGHANDH